jgi:hypothetical protein
MKSDERRLSANAHVGVRAFGTKTRSGVTGPRTVCRLIIWFDYRLPISWMRSPGPSLVTLMNSQSVRYFASGDTRCSRPRGRNVATDFPEQGIMRL